MAVQIRVGRTPTRDPTVRRELHDRSLVHAAAEFRAQFTFHPEVAGFGRRFGENPPRGVREADDDWDPPWWLRRKPCLSFAPEARGLVSVYDRVAVRGVASHTTSSKGYPINVGIEGIVR